MTREQIKAKILKILRSHSIYVADDQAVVEDLVDLFVEAERSRRPTA